MAPIETEYYDLVNAFYHDDDIHRLVGKLAGGWSRLRRCGAEEGLPKASDEGS